MKLGNFAEGERVRLLDEALEKEGTVCTGTIVEMVVTDVKVRFDDGETITFRGEDPDFVLETKPK